MSGKRGAPAPAVVGSHFVKQYYGEVLSKKLVELHRFYKDESTFCHASGTKEEEPVSGLVAIKAKIEHLGLGGATVDLGCGSVDAQPSEGDGVLLMVTGSITMSDRGPRQFVQTFFLARQHQDNDKHNFYVRNDVFRFLDVLPEVVQAAYANGGEDNNQQQQAPTAPAAEPPMVEDSGYASGDEGDSNKEAALPAAGTDAEEVPVVPPSSVESPHVAAAASSPRVSGPAAPSEAQVGTSSADVSGDDGEGIYEAPPTKANKDSGAMSSSRAQDPEASSNVASTPPAEPAKLPNPTPASSVGATSPRASPREMPPLQPTAQPPATTYASLAKSWATVAAVGGGDAPAPSPRGAPSSGSTGNPATGGGTSNTPAPSTNGGWGLSDAAVSGSGSGSAFEPPPTPSGGGGGSGSGTSRPSSTSNKKGAQYIPHHASPAVAASALAAREAAAAGNAEITPATSLFVRKVDLTIEKEDMIKHFSAYGEVTGITMNPTRGYAFIDYGSNECVARALSVSEHYVKRKMLVVEERHSPMISRNSRGEHGGRGRGGRGRGSSGRDGRDGDRGDRRSAGRGQRGGMGRSDRDRDRSDGGTKDGGYKSRARAEPS